MTRIPITGIGVIAPGAIGLDAFRALLDSGATAISAVERFDTEGLHAHKAGLVRDFNARDFIAPMKARRMNVLSRYAVSAARLALRDAQIEKLDSSAGVALGTAFGPVQTSVEYMREYVEKGAALAPPQLFAESVANAPGSHIAIEHGLRGFNITVSQRESSTLAAVMFGASQIAKGAARAALVGGVEEINEMIYSVLDRLNALAHADGSVGEAARPFDRRRNGMVIGEGSAVLLAEATPSRKVYAYLAGFGIARDTSATISDWGDDQSAVVAAMRAAIADAGIAIGDIDAVYASANSTQKADRLEYRAIESLFGAAGPAVVATKGYFGEYAAGGSLQFAAAVLAVADQVLHGSAGFEQGDDEMHLSVNAARRVAPLRHVLVNSISAGGGIVSAILSKEAS